jgi:hypothetical protein
MAGFNFFKYTILNQALNNCYRKWAQVQYLKNYCRICLRINTRLAMSFKKIPSCMGKVNACS